MMPEDFSPTPPAEPPPTDDRRDHWKRTMREAAALLLLSLLLASILKVAKLDFLLPSQANQESLEFFSKNSLPLLFVLAVVMAPVLEESLFRGLPFALWRPLSRVVPGACWIIGALAALLFAAAHGIEPLPKGGYKLTGLPLPQLMLGLWSWHVINTRGLRYSMLLHATYNGILVLVLLLASQLVKQ